MASWFLKIVLNGETKTFPIRRDGFSLQMKAGEDGKHSASSCQIAVRGSSVLQGIMYASGLVEAQILDDEGSVIFTGVIRPYASVTAEPMHLGDLQLEVLDYTERLHKKVYAKPDKDYGSIDKDNIIFEDNWDGFKVCNPSDKAHSIVHSICKLCGINLTDAPVIDVTIHRFSLESGQYLDDVLGTLLYEYVYDYRFDANGVMHIYQTGTITEVEIGEDGQVVDGSAETHDLESSKTIDVFNNSLTISRDDEARNGALVKYDKFKSIENVCIYNKLLDGGWTPIVEVGTVATFDGDVKWDLSEIVDNGGTDIQLSDFWVSGKDESWGAANAWATELVISDCDEEGGHLKYRIRAAAGALFNEVKYRIRIYADVTYLKSESRTIGYAGENAEEYSAQYIQDLDKALSLATAIKNRVAFNNFKYKFQSFEKMEPGTVVTLHESSISGLEAIVRITKRTLPDETMLYSYEAEGYGSSEFSSPEIDRDEDPNLPQNQPDFFLMSVSEDNVLPDTEDNSPIYAETWGAIFSKYGATPTWYLNGVLLEGFTSLHIEFSKQMLAPGINRLRVTAEYDGEIYSIEKPINYISSDLEIQMQFAAVPKGESPDSSTVWQNTQPVPGENEVLWMRFRTTASGEWIVVKMTAEDGGNPVVFFQWAATPYIKPDDAFELLTWDDMAITWEVDGNVTGFVLDSGRWETLVPDKPFGLNYLWVKYWNYQEEQWDYFCTTGTPAMDFNLIVNPQTYKLTSRGVTQEDNAYTDRCQRINVRCQRLNTTAPISWSIEPENEQLLSWERVDDNDDSEIVIIIKTMIALPNITIHCSIADIDVAKEFVVSGVQEGIAEIMYMGIFTSTGAFPNTTSEGPLMVGDHVLLEESNGNRTPYYWNGSAWVMADANTPVESAWKMLSNVLYDATHAPGTISSQSIVNLFAQNFAAYNAFIYNLMVRNLRVGAGSSTSGFRFDVYDYQNGSRVTPVIRARYNGNVVFQINPSTGDVFFGRPNSQLNAPATGFMYDASAGTLRSVNDNVVIGTNGAITAKSGSFSGTVTATSGSFSGTLNAAKGTITDATITNSTVSGVLISGAIRTEQSQYGDYSVTLYKDDWYQASSFMTSLVKYGGYNYIWGSSIWLRATSPEIPELAYINYFTTMHAPPNDGVVQGDNIIMYDSNMEDLDITKLGLPYVQHGSGAISNGIQCFENSSGTGLSRYTIIDQDFTINVTWGETLILNVPFAGLRDMVQGQVYAEPDGTLKIHF